MTAATRRLLAERLEAPRLPRALCRGRHALFDPRRAGEDPEAVAERHSEARGLCAMCPELDACGRWYDSLPKDLRPTGIIAGRHRWSTRIEEDEEGNDGQTSGPE
jgi:hypothetical protein